MVTVLPVPPHRADPFSGWNCSSSVRSLSSFAHSAPDFRAFHQRPNLFRELPIGNFKLVCLVHLRMTGAIHVLAPSATLPHDQNFYDQQADFARRELLSGVSDPDRGDGREDVRSPTPEVTAGVSVIAVNGGGSETAAVMRFVGSTTVVHVGDRSNGPI